MGLKHNSVLALLIALVVYPQVSETIYTPSLPDIARAFGVSTAWTGLTLSFYFFGFAFGVLFWGILSDWIGRRPAMIWGLGVYALGTLGCALSGDIFVLIAARFLQAFGASTGSVVTQTMLRDLYSGAQRNKIFAQITAVIALSPAIGPLVGGYLDEWFGFRSNFIFLLGIAVILLWCSQKRLPETMAHSKKPNLPALLALLKRMLMDRHVINSVVLIAITNGIMFGYYAEAPFIFIDLLGFSAGQYGWLGILISLSMMLSAWMSHRIENWLGFEHMKRLGSFIMLFGSILLMISISGGILVPMFLGAISLVFLGIGLILPGTLSRVLKSYQDVLGSAGALLGLMYYLLIGILVEVVGLVHQENLAHLGIYFIILSVLVSVSCIYSQCTSKNGRGLVV
ncbi:MAG: multidrug effflux MFS transporter [Myxococcaceae bacterium]